jgi:thiamine-phosphate pyrophosphorylase
MAMQNGQSLPRIWLVTDERQGDRLLPAVARSPGDAGILFRHYSLRTGERRALFREVCGARAGRMVLLAGPPELAREWGADGWHGWGKGEGPRSASVHDLDEIRRAEAEGADLLFLGPVYPTRSHPGATALGPAGFARLAAQASRPVIALGGVNELNAPELLRLGAYGWGAIDAWTT